MSKLTDRVLGGLLVALIGTALVGGLYEAIHGENEPTRGLLARGAVAPPFMAVRHADKKPISNDALQGKVIVLDFWGTWCPPCREEAPVVRDIARAYASQPVAVLAMDDEQDADDPVAAVSAFLAEHHLEDYPVAYPAPGVLDRYRVTHFPTLYVIGKDGRVRFRAVGLTSESRLRAEVDAALKG